MFNLVIRWQKCQVNECDHHLEIVGDVNLSSIDDDNELKTNDDFGIPIH